MRGVDGQHSPARVAGHCVALVVAHDGLHPRNMQAVVFVPDDTPIAGRGPRVKRLQPSPGALMDARGLPDSGFAVRTKRAPRPALSPRWGLVGLADDKPRPRRAFIPVGRHADEKTVDVLPVPQKIVRHSRVCVRGQKRGPRRGLGGLLFGDRFEVGQSWARADRERGAIAVFEGRA